MAEGGTEMYAVVTVFAMDEDQLEEQRKNLHAGIIPSVKQNPGFRAGYWTRDRASGRSHNLLLFDTEQQAQHVRGSVEQSAELQREMGVRLELVAVTEVEAEEHQ
jgi:hypothetical protein